MKSLCITLFALVGLAECHLCATAAPPSVPTLANLESGSNIIDVRFERNKYEFAPNDNPGVAAITVANNADVPVSVLSIGQLLQMMVRLPTPVTLKPHEVGRFEFDVYVQTLPSGGVLNAAVGVMLEDNRAVIPTSAQYRFKGQPELSRPGVEWRNGEEAAEKEIKIRLDNGYVLRRIDPVGAAGEFVTRIDSNGSAIYVHPRSTARPAYAYFNIVTEPALPPRCRSGFSAAVR